MNLGRASGGPFLLFSFWTWRVPRIKCRYGAKIILPKINLGRASGGLFHFLCFRPEGSGPEGSQCRYGGKLLLPKINLSRASGGLFHFYISDLKGLDLKGPKELTDLKGPKTTQNKVTSCIRHGTSIINVRLVPLTPIYWVIIAIIKRRTSAAPSKTRCWWQIFAEG